MNDLVFDYATVTARGCSVLSLANALRADALPALEARGGCDYGIWAPQFGLASNRLVWMTGWERAAEREAAIEVILSAHTGVAHFEHHGVRATARPRSAEPPRKPGVYVHRWFDLHPTHVEEVVHLSARAWETFEATFEVEVIGFFETLGKSEETQLMLLNWYPSLAAWEASRNFDADPESKKRFVRRAELTSGTRAITTTLLLP